MADTGAELLVDGGDGLGEGAVVLDALLEKDFVPAGYSEEDGGRLYQYQRADAAQLQV